MTGDFKLIGNINENYRTTYTRKQDLNNYIEGHGLGRLFPNGTKNLDPNSESGKLVSNCLQNTDCADGFENGQRTERNYQALLAAEQTRLNALGFPR